MSQGSGEPDVRRWLALALLGTAFFMVILDGTIVYVALPSIDEALGFSSRGLQWVMSAYLLTFGGLLLLGGRSSDLLGRRRMFMVGVSLFAGSSLLCGLAWSDRPNRCVSPDRGALGGTAGPAAYLPLATFGRRQPRPAHRRCGPRRDADHRHPLCAGGARLLDRSVRPRGRGVDGDVGRRRGQRPGARNANRAEAGCAHGHDPRRDRLPGADAGLRRRSYFGDLFLGLLLFGAGLGATFVASQIAALSGIAEEESGLAAGLVDSSFNIGSALGIAVLSTVAVARTEDVLAGGGPSADPSLAMTEGYQTAFLVAFGIAVLGALLALVLFQRRDMTEDAAIEAVRRAAPCPPTRASGVPEVEVERGS